MSLTRHEIYAVQEVPGRGHGLVAIQRIPRGTRILSEEPAIKLPYGSVASEQTRELIVQQVNALDETQRGIFLSMHNIYPYKDVTEQYLGITKTVSLPVEEKEFGAAIFLEACRINHACDNNAQKSWNTNIKRHTVHALRDIEEGEEITVYYIAEHNSREQRQAKLRARFDFTCSCHLCSLPPDDSKKSDGRLKEISQLDESIQEKGAIGIMMNPSGTLDLVERMVKLYNEEGPGDIGLARCYFDAAQVVLAHGDLSRGRILVERAVDAWRVALGDDCDEVLEYGRLALTPQTHPMYRSSGRWKSAVDDVPSDLNPAEFEDWLWRRDPAKKPARAGQPANLRDSTVFTTAKDLPDEGRLNPNFFESSSTDEFTPLRHWCLLAEIEDFQTLHHLEMGLKDADDVTIPFHFYTEGLGREIGREKAKVGYTAAVLYAKTKRFKFSAPGIRHEDEKLLKIFPTSLQSLLELNDEIQMFGLESEGVRKCHGCGKEAVSLVRCARCSLFWYCNKDCQTSGWKTKGHKDQCKLLKNPDLQRLFTFKWGDFNGEVQFPLPATR